MNELEPPSGRCCLVSRSCMFTLSFYVICTLATFCALASSWQKNSIRKRRRESVARFLRCHTKSVALDKWNIFFLITLSSSGGVAECRNLYTAHSSVTAPQWSLLETLVRLLKGSLLLGNAQNPTVRASTGRS